MILKVFLLAILAVSLQAEQVYNNYSPRVAWDPRGRLVVGRASVHGDGGPALILDRETGQMVPAPDAVVIDGYGTGAIGGPSVYGDGGSTVVSGYFSQLPRVRPPRSYRQSRWANTGY